MRDYLTALINVANEKINVHAYVGYATSRYPIFSFHTARNNKQVINVFMFKVAVKVADAGMITVPERHRRTDRRHTA